MKKLVATVAAGLSLFGGAAIGSSPAHAAGTAPPTYANYLTCVGSWMYTDFVDPDGDDTLLHVYGETVVNGQNTTFEFLNSGPSYHGVFFAVDLAQYGISDASKAAIWFRAVDQTGQVSDAKLSRNCTDAATNPAQRGPCVGKRTWSDQTALDTSAVSSGAFQSNVAYTGLDSRLYLLSQCGNIRTALNETSIAGPALTEYQGELYIAWTGTDAAHRINVMKVGDPASKKTFDESSFTSPGLAVDTAGRLVVAWTGTDAGRHLNVMPVFDPVKKQVLNDTSIAGPSLLTYDGHTWISWAGTDAGRSLNVMPLDDPAQKRVLPESTTSRPSLYASGGLLRVAWTGTDAQRHVNVATLTGPYVKTVLTETAIAGPGVMSTGPVGNLTWGGTDAGRHLNSTNV